MIPKYRVWLPCKQAIVNALMIDFENKEVMYRWKDKSRTATYIDTDAFGDVSIMQSTGLKDKNGVEIFEGDIVRRARPCKPEDEIMHIGFANGSFYTTFFPDWCRTSLFSYIEFGNQVEIIGNIYEQPDSTNRTGKTGTTLG